jgi:hypothetical protein
VPIPGNEGGAPELQILLLAMDAWGLAHTVEDARLIILASGRKWRR